MFIDKIFIHNVKGRCFREWKGRKKGKGWFEKRGDAGQGKEEKL